MSTSGRPTATPQFVVGLFIMLFGLLLLLDRLGILAAAQGLRWWPVVLIAAGAWVLGERRHPRGRVGGTILLVLGLWLLLNSLGVVVVSFWGLFWPFVMIWIGLTLVRQTLGRGTVRGRPGPSEPSLGDAAPDVGARWQEHTKFFSRGPTWTEQPGTVSVFSALGAAKRSSSDSPFRGGEMTSFMGGCMLDLRRATIPPGGEAVIDVFAVMGGLELWVPSGWIVVSQVVPVMGGVDDKRLPPLEPVSPETGPRLIVRGMVMMGGLIIKT